VTGAGIEFLLKNKMEESSQQYDLVNNEDREGLTLVSKDIIDRVSHAYLSLNTLNKEIEHQRNQSRDLHRNAEILESRLKESQNAIDTLSREKSVLNGHLTQIRQKLQDSERALIEEKKQANQKKLEMYDTTTRLEYQIQETQSRLTITQQSLNEISANNCTLKKQLQEQRDRYEQELYSLRQHANKHKEEKLTLENSLNKLQRDLLDKEANVRQLTGTQTKLENSTKTLQARIQELERPKTAQGTEFIPSFQVDEGLIKKLCEELNTNRSRRTEVEQEVQNLQAHLNALLHEIEEKAPVLARREREYEELVMAYNQLLSHKRVENPTEISELEMTRSQLETERYKNKDLKIQIDKLVDECHEQANLIKKYIAKSDTKHEFEQTRSKLFDDSKQKLKKAEEDVIDLSAQLKSKDSKIAHLRKESNELKMKLEETEKKLQQERSIRLIIQDMPSTQPEGIRITSELLKQIQDMEFYTYRIKDLEESVLEARTLFEKCNQEKEALRSQLNSIRQENTSLRSKNLNSDSETKKLKSELEHLRTEKSQLAAYKQELEQRLMKTQNNAYMPSLFQKASSYKLDETLLAKLSQTEKELSDTRKAWNIEVSKLKLELENYKLLASQNYGCMDMMEIEHIKSYSKKLNKIIKLMQKDNNLLISENEALISQLSANEPATMSQEEILVLKQKMLDITHNYNSLNSQVDMIRQDYINQIYSLQSYIQEQKIIIENEVRSKEALEETVADREQHIDILRSQFESLNAQLEKANEILMSENEIYRSEFPPLPEEDNVSLVKAQNLKLRERVKQLEIKRMLEVEHYQKLMQRKDQDLSEQSIQIGQLDARSKELDSLCRSLEERLETCRNAQLGEESLHRLLSSIHAALRLSMSS
jgi:chromosome segregation ATPase